MLAGLSWQDIPDSELVARIGQAVSSAQREAAFDVIYQRHAPAVLAVCGGRLYDDPDAAQAAAQVALVTAYRDLTEGRPPREPDKLHSWLRGIAANRCHGRSAADAGKMPFPIRSPMTSTRLRADAAGRKWTGFWVLSPPRSPSLSSASTSSAPARAYVDRRWRVPGVSRRRRPTTTPGRTRNGCGRASAHTCWRWRDALTARNWPGSSTGPPGTARPSPGCCDCGSCATSAPARPVATAAPARRRKRN